jgi:hypothetical protein
MLGNGPKEQLAVTDAEQAMERKAHRTLTPRNDPALDRQLGSVAHQPGAFASDEHTHAAAEEHDALKPSILDELCGPLGHLALAFQRCRGMILTPTGQQNDGRLAVAARGPTCIGGCAQWLSNRRHCDGSPARGQAFVLVLKNGHGDTREVRRSARTVRRRSTPGRAHLP